MRRIKLIDRCDPALVECMALALWRDGLDRGFVNVSLGFAGAMIKAVGNVPHSIETVLK